MTVLVAAGALVLAWRRHEGTRWTRVRYTAAVLVGLSFVWSLYYWNLLGWRL